MAAVRRSRSGVPSFSPSPSPRPHKPRGDRRRDGARQCRNMGGDIDDATVCTERLIVVDVTVVVSHSRKNGPLCRARATEPAAFEGALGETDCTMRSTR
jgi:hypothetical protein